MRKFFIAFALMFACQAMGAGTVVNTPGIPAGAIMAFAMANCPQGWVAADGTPRSKTVVYKALCDAITTTWGAGDASNCATPNFKTGCTGSRSCFLRAANATIPVGTSGILDQMTAKNGLAVTNNAVTSGTESANHTHSLGFGFGSGSAGNGAYVPGTASGGSIVTVSSYSMGTQSASHTHSVTSNVTLGAGDAETRPVSAAVTYCIKY